MHRGAEEVPLDQGRLGAGLQGNAQEVPYRSGRMCRVHKRCQAGQEGCVKCEEVARGTMQVTKGVWGIQVCMQA